MKSIKIDISNSELITELKYRLKQRKLKLLEPTMDNYDKVIFLVEDLENDKNITALYNNEKAIKNLGHKRNGRGRVIGCSNHPGGCPKCSNCNKSDHLEICIDCKKELCCECLGRYHIKKLFCDKCFDKKNSKEKEKLLCDRKWSDKNK